MILIPVLYVASTFQIATSATLALHVPIARPTIISIVIVLASIVILYSLELMALHYKSRFAYLVNIFLVLQPVFLVIMDTMLKITNVFLVRIKYQNAYSVRQAHSVLNALQASI